MSKPKQYIIDDLKKQLKEALRDSEWYRNKFVLTEEKIIALRETIGELEDEQ